MAKAPSSSPPTSPRAAAGAGPAPASCRPGAPARGSSTSAGRPTTPRSFAQATRFEGQAEKAVFLRRHPGSAPPSRITPYLAIGGANFAYAGASADGETAIFEVAAALPPKEGEEPIAAAAPQGSPNVYAYDEDTGRFSLASVLNTGPETEAALPRGATAGRYGFLGYLEDPRTVASDGAVIFTAKGSGQLYQRLNPTQPQSAMQGGQCTEPDKACTLHLSASHRTPPDPGGAREGAFRAASADGRTVFFTSSEELTDDANTGPDQPPAQIGRATLNGEEPAEDIDEGFIPANALGLATSPDGEYLYWADPVKGTIGRANLKAPVPAATVDPEFIVPGNTEAETHPIKEPGVFESAPTTPRYVAADSEHVYWTNTGPLGKGGSQYANQPVPNGGTVGRATLDPLTGELEGTPEPEFTKGAWDPQGIAVDGGHVYWGHRGIGSGDAIGRATIDGSQVEQDFQLIGGADRASGLTVTADGLYAGHHDQGDNGGYVTNYGLDGEGKLGASFLGKDRPLGLTTDGSSLYWVVVEVDPEAEEPIPGQTTPLVPAIGRVPVSSFGGNCGANSACSKEFLTPDGSPFGLATSGNHLYWSVNGETPPHPGNDLYRYQAEGTGSCEEGGGCLTDLTPDAADPNGAEVVGVLGASGDGSHLYFTANADLDGAGGAEAGNCKGPIGSTTGLCSLYHWHEGEIAFLARLNAEGGETNSDSRNWAEQVSAANNGSYTERTSFLAGDGETLLFSSQEQLTGYENGGTPEYYLYRAGQPGLLCVTCHPSGAAPEVASRLFSYLLWGIGPARSSITSARTLSADGNRVFFETTEALVGADVDGLAGCPNVGNGAQESFHTCRDVYEWEAPGAGSCSEGAPSFSSLNGGCLYLISPGDDGEVTLFADASASGDEVFFFTRTALVGSDQDQLFDVYDARVGGGLAAQNQTAPVPCEGEGCKPPPAPPPRRRRRRTRSKGQATRRSSAAAKARS